MSIGVEPNLHNHEARITALEESVEKLTGMVSDIQHELKRKAESDARIAQVVEHTSKEVSEVKEEVKTMNSKLLDAILEAKKDEREAYQQTVQSDKNWYQKVIFYCIAALATLLLGVFGVKQIIGI